MAGWLAGWLEYRLVNSIVGGGECSDGAHTTQGLFGRLQTYQKREQERAK